MRLSRRNVLGAGAAGLAGALPAGAAYARTRVRPPITTTLTGKVWAIGNYLELPFHVPHGVTRLDVAMTKSGSGNVGLGIFDQRGAHYQSPGFRGIFGQERSEFFLSAHAATESFIPGPIHEGTWTIIVPVFEVPEPMSVDVKVTMSFHPQGRPFKHGPLPGVVVDKPGWYRGDLHCHTPHSSDAWSSHSAMYPHQWADACRRIGLDFVSMTDHNVISQNYFLAKDAGKDVLLLAGEEMTNWFHGHATVSGLEPGQWLDWRQSPLGLPLPTGSDGARISDFIKVATEMGAYVAVAHPYAGQLLWQFQGDAEADPASRTHGYEVWTSGWQPDDELALHTWDTMLVSGWQTVANGGSDLHGVKNSNNFPAGLPTTIVYADKLAKKQVLDAVKGGRSFVTKAPDGVEVYLTATAPDQATYVGGSVYGAVGDLVDVSARVRRAGGMRLIFTTAGAPIQQVDIGSDDETHTVQVPIVAGGYVRAEVRRNSVDVSATNPLSSQLDMEAFTNPIWLVEGDVPADYEKEYAPVPARPGPRRMTA